MQHSSKTGKVLVTGGAGFIGSALIWQLNREGIDNILVTDFLGEDDKYQNLVPLRFADYLEGDALLELIEKNDPLLQDVKTIFHLGACSATTERNARYLIQNNYEYTRRLAEWALRYDVRFVYASSAATYGDGTDGMDDKMEDISRLRPLNMYGYSKHLFDLHAKRNGYLDRLVGLKYFNVYGPNEYHKGSMVSMVYRAFHQIKQEGSVKLFQSDRPEYKDGEQMRDFLYVKDAVSVTLHLARTPTAGGLFNVGSGKARTWLDLMRAIFAAQHLPEKVDFIPMPDVLKAKYQYFTEADITKLRTTGYHQEIPSLEESVADYVKNYLIPGKHLGE
ncbi:MAG: ADP-glyceromanno-heptose 6-epimerase [Puniceicoccales bacterium]|jgi:ADP-L-glycero-D-manno-heptose 6-epimerase|nr:ADP-glyceromanno-heptose 6-epimerase [Puniceicoccales bacterium]